MAVEFESPPHNIRASGTTGTTHATHATETAQTSAVSTASGVSGNVRQARNRSAPADDDADSQQLRPQRRADRRSASAPLRIALPLLLAALLILAWQFATQSGAVSPYLLPAPADVARSFWLALTSGYLTPYALATLGEALAGFALGAVIALPLGYLLAKSRWLAAALEPYLAASQAMPAVALAPLIVLWLGYGLPSIATLCALIVFFPMVVNTTLGVRQVDDELLDAARVDGAGAGALLLGIEAPLALRTVLAGLRVAITLSVTGAVVGEFVIGDTGLGGLLNIARGDLDTPLVFATLLTLALLAGLLYGLARGVELATPALIALALALLTALLTLRFRLMGRGEARSAPTPSAPGQAVPASPASPTSPTSPTLPTTTIRADSSEVR